MRYMIRVFLIMILGTMIPAVWGGSFVYSTQRREVKVCNLIFPQFPGEDPRLAYENPDPYVFYVLDRRTDLKPLNWEFVNPLTPTRVTQLIMDRWANRMNPGNNYVLGQPVGKNMGCYWEVDISTVSAEDLAEFDLIFVTNHRQGVRFRAEDKEKLRRAVDGGATVWIEDCGNFTIDPNFPFFMDVNFRSAGAPGVPNVVNPNHPILTTPYTLTPQEISQLGDKNYRGFITNLGGNATPDPVLVPIILNGGSGLPYIAAGQYGSGFVVASSGDAGCTINDFVGGVNAGYGGNSGPYSGELMELSFAHDLKLAYNIVSWAFSSTTYQKNPRRTGFSRELIGAPLNKKWELPTGGGIAPSSSPGILKNVVFVGGANGIFYALDGEPYNDLDGDGNPDDGVPDLGVGASFDVVWQANLGGDISSPTIVSIAGEDRVLVVASSSQNATLYCFWANNTTGAPALRWSQQLPGGYQALPNETRVNVPAPVYDSENLLVYVGTNDAANNGIVVAYSVADGSEKWRYPDQQITPYQPWGRIETSPALAYVRDESSGAVDRVLYVTTSGTQQAGGGVYSLVLGARNEPLQYTRAGSNFRSSRGFNFPWDTNRPFFVRASDATQVYNVTATPQANGEVTLAFTPTPPDPPGLGALTVTADYDFLIQAGVQFKFRSFLPILRGNQTQIDQVFAASGPAVGPEDIVYFAGRSGTAATDVDYIYAIRERGRVNQPPRVKWKFSNKIAGNYKVNSNPAVGGGLVYVTYQNDSGTESGIGALEANPDYTISGQWTVQVQNGQPVRVLIPFGSIDNDPSRPVTITQEDRSLPAGQNMRTIPRNHYIVDYDQGKITFTDLTFLDSCSLPRVGAFPAFQPVLVTYFPRGSQTPVTVEVSISNLVWFSLIPGRVESAPRIIGDRVYVGVNIGNRHEIWAFHTDVRKHTYRILNLDITPQWQVGNFPFQVGGAGVSGLPSIPLDQAMIAFGAEDIGGDIGAAVGAASGLLVVNAQDGIKAFHSPGTVITDSSRILEVDPSGKVLWSLSSVDIRSVVGGSLPVYGPDGNPIAGTGTGELRVSKSQLSRPAAVKKIGNVGYLIADTGNNRILQIDRSGNVSWLLTEFSLPPLDRMLDYPGLRVPDPNNPGQFLARWRAGDIATLSQPGDIFYWTTTETDPLDGQPAIANHYLIADTGNFRVVEIVDWYYPDGRPKFGNGEPHRYHEMVWVSTPTSEGNRFKFRTVQRFIKGSEIMTVCAVGNYRLPEDPAEIADQGGCLVNLDYATGNISQVVTDIQTPAGRKRIVNPRSLTRYQLSASEEIYLLADANGVYELNGLGQTNWTLTNEDYRRITGIQGIDDSGIPLIATSARLLTSTDLDVNGRPRHRVLITNSYVGLYKEYLRSDPNVGFVIDPAGPQTDFHGEVFELKASDFFGPGWGGPFLNGNVVDISNQSVIWRAPRLVSKTYLDLRAPGGIATDPLREVEGTYRLEQPSAADR